MRDLDDELWKLGVFARTEHNEVAPGAARARAGVHRRERCRRPQPADDGADAEDRAEATVSPACCTKSRSPASTAAASTTTGRCRTDTGENLFEPRQEPGAERARFCCSCAAVIQRGGRASGSAAHRPWLPRATTIVWAAMKPRRRSCPCSWATIIDSRCSMPSSNKADFNP